MRGELYKLARKGKLLTPFIRPIPLSIRRKLCFKCYYSRILAMAKDQPKIIKDPVYGSIELDPDDVFLLDTCFLQRLRFVRQTSFLNYLIPTAMHTRFDHSLGTYFWAKNIVLNLEANSELRELAYDIYEEIIALLNELLSNPKEDLYEHYRGIIRDIDKEALKEKRIILRLDKDHNLTIDREKFCYLWMRMEYYVVKYAALLHDIAHYPFSHLGEKANRILLISAKKKLNARNLKQLSDKIRTVGREERINQKRIDVILRFVSRYKLIVGKKYCGPYNRCKPHELDAFRLILQKEFKDEDPEKKTRKFKEAIWHIDIVKEIVPEFKNELESIENKIRNFLMKNKKPSNGKGIIANNCIRASLYYLLKKAIIKVASEFDDIRSVINNEKFSRKVFDLLGLLGLHPELLLFKVAIYIQSECFLRHLFDVLYEARGEDDLQGKFTGGLTLKDFKRIKYTALDYKKVAINYSLRQLINGSWLDVDKLDYISRDSFFLGLEFKPSEFMRIIRGIHLVRIFDGNKKEYVLAVDYKLLGNIFSLLVRRHITDAFIIKHRINTYLEKQFEKYLKLEFGIKAEHKEDVIVELLEKIELLRRFRKKTDFTILEELKKRVINNKEYPNVYLTLITRSIEKAVGILFLKSNQEISLCKKQIIFILTGSDNDLLKSISIIEIKMKDLPREVTDIWVFDRSSHTAFRLSNSAMLEVFMGRNLQKDLYFKAYHIFIKVGIDKTSPNLQELHKMLQKLKQQIPNFKEQLKQQGIEAQVLFRY